MCSLHLMIYILSPMQFKYNAVFYTYIIENNKPTEETQLFKVQLQENLCIYSVFLSSGDTSSKTNIWPISNTECQKWAKSAKLSFSRVYLYIQDEQNKITPYIYKKKIIFEHIPILKQFPNFSSCLVFGTSWF